MSPSSTSTRRTTCPDTGRTLTSKLPLVELSRLLAEVREQLLGLLSLVEQRESPEVAALPDRDFHITEPLDLPA